MAEAADDLAGARRHLDRAASLGIGVADRALADVIELRLDSIAGRHEAARDRARALRDIDRRVTAERAGVVLALALDAARHDDPADALDRIAELAALESMAGDRLAAAAWTRYRLGQWDDAVGDANSSMAEAARTSRPGSALARAALIAVAVERDRPGEVVAAITAAREATHDLGVHDWAIARWAAASGDLDGALDRLEHAVARARVAGRVDDLQLLLPERAILADAAGLADVAADDVSTLEALTGEGSRLAARLSTLLTAATVRRDADAARAAAGLAADHALRVDEATALAVASAIDDGGDGLVVAHDRLGALGALARQRQVARRLRAAGRRVRAGRAAGALTPTEHDVAALVGQGHTNRQIAALSGLTPKTVETYVSRILAKTGYRSRTQLAIAITSGDLA